MEWVYMLRKEGGTRESIKLASIMARRDGWQIVGWWILFRSFVNF
jgi:hypothetical protein